VCHHVLLTQLTRIAPNAVLVFTNFSHCSKVLAVATPAHMSVWPPMYLVLYTEACNDSTAHTMSRLQTEFMHRYTTRDHAAALYNLGPAWQLTCMS